ncbi:hypothetical protein [Saccharopolyspora sp. ASAGF58]|uniref:hypothetical protein n=1 Tax=Saccharopolyspora sp. ASAGF58 TaxID=2719023 RepID=UPI00143FFDA0|nr:hypothetical protein [Saccharopolyspora sp. ASAGF58]QIZ37669.1 hypothetical protein FDZ84_27665 [Saccharopolyspora sp. ASAGF58]
MSPQELPLIDYDNGPVGSLQHRIRSLDGQEIQQLLDYEREHNNRVQVMEILEKRSQELRDGATPSGGAQDDRRVEAEGTAGESPVEPSGSPEPRHGIGGLPGKPEADRPRNQ